MRAVPGQKGKGAAHGNQCNIVYTNVNTYFIKANCGPYERLLNERRALDSLHSASKSPLTDSIISLRSFGRRIGGCECQSPC